MIPDRNKLLFRRKVPLRNPNQQQKDRSEEYSN
jgi:hypothetical protein